MTPDPPKSVRQPALRHPVRLRVVLALFVSLFLAPFRSLHAYAVLTHQHLIDEAWTSTIAPLLLKRFPSLTPAQLRDAHAYAYGGCVIQDLGYYPFNDEFFSNLTHYVRSGEFVRSLFQNAHTADELAFAIGALTHYIGDSIGHEVATNRAVAEAFPKLREKYGPSVNFAQAKNAHGQVEFAFDINQITKEHFAPPAYLRSVGLKVPRDQLRAAFFQTYGFHLRHVFGVFRTRIRIYRFGARSFLPAFAYAEALLHRHSFPPETPGPELDLYEQRAAHLAQQTGWAKNRKPPGIRTYLLAGLVFILPKIGPMKMLAIKGPTVETEKWYIESVNLSTTALHSALAHLSPRNVLPAGIVPDRDLDTGFHVVPGGYRLTDETYAKLLRTVTKDPSQPVPKGLKQDILSYYADPNAPIATRRNPKKWAEVQDQLRILRSIETSERESLSDQDPSDL